MDPRLVRVCVAAIAALSIVGCGDDDRGGGVPRTDGGPVTDGGPIDTDAGPEPDAGTDAGPSCVDEDGDGYGEGCDLGTDCDDTDGSVSPAASETCNGVDDDCNGTIDDALLAPSCGLVEGVCAGATARCGGDAGFLECDATDYGASFEADETACDGLDNDCDGSTDEGCTCTPGATQACGSDVGVCMPGTQTCSAAATWGPCEGETAPMGEVCDGMDNDCDGSSDDAGDLVAPACPLQLGVCAGSVRRCGGVAGWVACSGIESYGGDYQATETLCDGRDNDCDGVVDEGCTCIDGATQSCGTDIGACVAGTQTCTAGSWGACAGETRATAEACNGGDDDCDGSTDEALTGPACALQAGVCAGSTQRCAGAGGFVACTAADYGSTYQATETRCDGLDNDCDGTPDEGCSCIDGTTQECGISTGACERGTQTCSGGAWGACTGGVGPTAELCNGLDDDCNGASDDNLTAPACALTSGVCSGSRQTCGGAAGWQACTAATYGPRYSMTEDGATNEAICDGLDNDCDGSDDEGCTSGPLLTMPEDAVLPDIFHRHVVYLVNFDGNWDVVFSDLNAGTSRRLTTTAASEWQPRVYGNHVVFVRGVDAAARVVLYDLRTDVETVLSTRQSDTADIAGGAVVWDEYDGTQWDIQVHDIQGGTTSGLFTAPTTSNEIRPSLRGGRLAYLSDVTGTLLTQVIDFGAMTPVPVTQTPASSTAAGQLDPIVDYEVVGWTDGRAITSATPAITDNWNLYAAPFGASGTLLVYPGENVLSNAMGAQVLRAVDGAVFAWNDYRSGNWNPVIGDLAGTEVILSTHPGTQADPSISGNIVVWEDNRLGTYDIYGSTFGGSQAPMPGWVVINEILADPPAGADVNRDGTASTTSDELVEITNATGVAIDISGLTLSDAVGVRHTFPANTVLPALGSIVVFGGGSPAGVYGGARVQVASTGQLGLNNTGDTVTLGSGATVIDTVTYGAIGGNDQSIVRQPEVSGTTWVLHNAATGAVGVYSPGTSVRGFAF